MKTNIYLSIPSYVYIIVILLVIVFLIYRILVILKNSASKIRQMFLGHRFDDDNTLKYFSHNDYENMTQEMFKFTSNGLELQGYLYQVTPLVHKGVVVFVHGMGVGHIQYTNDIHHYCKLGYDVYTFDGQGCHNSQGDGLDYFSNYIKNLDDFLNYLKTKEELKDKKFIMVGHSLGGYAVNVISHFHSSDISKVVSFSPFINVEQLIYDKLKDNLKRIARFLAKDIAKQEFKHGKEYALDTIKVLKENNVDILFIHGDVDQVVNANTTFYVLKEKFKDNDNVHFMLVKDRNHNPYVTKESATYFKETRHQLDKLTLEYKENIPSEKLKEYYDSLDYRLMVELDDKVMNVVDAFIDNQKIEKEIVID